jgi:hypothetical protein
MPNPEAVGFDEFMFGVVVAAAAVALVLMLGSHMAGPGGGDRVCDYWRPRLRTRAPAPSAAKVPLESKPRVGKADAGTGGGSRGKGALEMQSLTAKSPSASKEGYLAVADESEV